LIRIEWSDGFPGYDPENLTIERFGLNLDFINDNSLSWIDNLITGSGLDLAAVRHPNHALDYVQDYLASIGERKCEANSLVVDPQAGRELIRKEIERWLGADALERFEERREEFAEKFEEFRTRTGLDEAIQDALDMIEEEE
jgi:hypothetical protein